MWGIGQNDIDDVLKFLDPLQRNLMSEDHDLIQFSLYHNALLAGSVKCSPVEQF